MDNHSEQLAQAGYTPTVKNPRVWTKSAENNRDVWITVTGGYYECEMGTRHRTVESAIKSNLTAVQRQKQFEKAYSQGQLAKAMAKW
jgi:hypothetical protein